MWRQVGKVTPGRGIASAERRRDLPGCVCSMWCRVAKLKQ